MPVPARQELCATVEGIGHVRLDLVERRARRSAGRPGRLGEAVRDLEPLRRRREAVEERVVDPSWTSIRFAEMQVCPEFRNLRTSAARDRPSRSASSKTMNGALPPSSSENFFFAFLRARAHQQLPDLGRAGEAELADEGLDVIALPIAGAYSTAPGDDRQDACGDARPPRREPRRRAPRAASARRA